MIDVGSIAAAIAGLKSATDIAKSLIDLKTTSEIQTKVIELQTVILAAQSSALAAQSDQSALLEEIRQLETQMANLEAWNAEKEKYELVEIVSGAFAYVRKESAKPPEPPHKLCADCYQHSQKSILQHETRMPGRASVYVCHQCGSEIYEHGPRFPEHSSGKRSSRRRSW